MRDDRNPDHDIAWIVPPELVDIVVAGWTHAVGINQHSTDTFIGTKRAMDGSALLVVAPEAAKNTWWGGSTG